MPKIIDYADCADYVRRLQIWVVANDNRLPRQHSIGEEKKLGLFISNARYKWKQGKLDADCLQLLMIYQGCVTALRAGRESAKPR